MNPGFSELLEKIRNNEQEIAVALAEDDHEKAAALGRQTADLIRQLSDAPKTPAQAAEFREFAADFIEHARKMLSQIEPERNQARDEIVRMQKASRGRNQYAQIRRSIR